VNTQALRAGQIQGQGSIVSGVPTKLEPLLLMHPVQYKSSTNELELRQLWPPKEEGVKNSEKQTVQHYKADSQTPKKSPKKFVVCCY
jgi:hypothetical protein